MEAAPTQLVLRVDRPEWRLDDRTREIGRRGLAEARATLRAARRREAARAQAAEASRREAGPATAA